MPLQSNLNTLLTDWFSVGDPNWTTFSAASGWGAPTFGAGIASSNTSGQRAAAFYSALSWAANPDQWASITLLTNYNYQCFTSVFVRGSTSGGPRVTNWQSAARLSVHLLLNSFCKNLSRMPTPRSMPPRPISRSTSAM